MHTIANTIIEDDVEIGCNCSIDSGVTGTTRIGKSTKLDNQIHIAHGVEIGINCLVCAQVAIAGKTTIGDNVTIYGKVGISKGLTIGDNAIILAPFLLFATSLSASDYLYYTIRKLKPPRSITTKPPTVNIRLT